MRDEVNLSQSSCLMTHTIRNNLHENYRPIRNFACCLSACLISIIETVKNARLLILSKIFSNHFKFNHHVKFEKNALSSSSFTVIWSAFDAIVGGFVPGVVEYENNARDIAKSGRLLHYDILIIVKNNYKNELQREIRKTIVEEKISYTSLSCDFVTGLKEIKKNKDLIETKFEKFLTNDVVYVIVMLLASLEAVIEIVENLFFKVVSWICLKLDKENIDFKYYHHINNEKLKSSKEALFKIFKESHKSKRKAPLEQQHNDQQKIPKYDGVYC
jgi:hypothetical protein